jgi:hypothetical protein
MLQIVIQHMLQEISLYRRIYTREQEKAGLSIFLLMNLNNYTLVGRHARFFINRYIVNYCVCLTVIHV